MNRKGLIIVLMSVVILLNLVGCTNTQRVQLEELQEMNLGEHRITEVDNPQAIGFDDFDAKRSIRDNNILDEEYLKSIKDFSARTAVELLRKQDPSANIMYSPISLYMALVLSASGANNQTQNEILSTLGMEKLGIDQLEEKTGNLFRLLYIDNEIGKLKIANSLWLDKDIPFKEEYIETAANDYYADLFSVDFSDKKTGDLIAQWISENSNGTLEQSNPVNEGQILSIINTIYFYDQWANKFDESKTKKDTFISYDGGKIKVDFMNMTRLSNFFEGDGYIGTSLGFKNQGSMNFYLPHKDVDVYDLISTQDKVEALVNRTHSSKIDKYGEVILKIPKFSFNSTLQMKEALRKIGIEKAFNPEADFTNLTHEDIAYISDITQSNHISINEKGCEASAFTQIVYLGSAPPKEKAEIVLDRPFIFTITAPNGVVLFMGIINDPTVE